MLRKNRHSRITRCSHCGCVAARLGSGWVEFEPRDYEIAEKDINYPVGPMDVEQMREYIDESLRRFQDER